jgi:ABC-2 type transporter
VINGVDEPTSGLDSFSAVQLCQVLKKVANAGASVLFTIHQPSSEIYNSFDQLILLNKGRVMYQGPVSGVPDYFAERGHPSPPNYNPADWIMTVAQSVPLEQLDESGFFLKDDREIGDPFLPGEGRDALGITITGREGKVAGFDERPPGAWTQTRLLFAREFTNLRRDTASLSARFALTTFLSMLVGVIFWQVGKTDSSVQENLQSHFGALLLVSMMTMLGTAMPSLLQFPSERPVFLREYSTNHYWVSTYFFSRLAMEAFVTAVQVMELVSTLEIVLR